MLLKYGANNSHKLRKMIMLGRSVERLMSGGYRLAHIHYRYAVNEIPNYVEFKASHLGGRYRLTDTKGRTDSASPVEMS